MDTIFDRNLDCGTAGTAVDTNHYALGYSESEFRRLEVQAALFRDFTEDVLRRAGLAPGMQVLDVGCGVGDVSLLAADLVGPSGAVLGIDRSKEALDVAKRRAAAAGRRNVRFAVTELDAFSTDRKFDAVIGRLVLLYVPNPAATLRRLLTSLRPGGIVAFQEMLPRLARSVPEGPQFRLCCQRIMDTFERAGSDLEMGGKLFATFLMLPPLIGAWTRLPAAGLTGSTTSGRASRSHRRSNGSVGAPRA